MIFRNHSYMLICCSRNISDYYQYWKKLCCLIVLWKPWYLRFIFQNSLMNRKFKGATFIWRWFKWFVYDLHDPLNPSDLYLWWNHQTDANSRCKQCEVSPEGKGHYSGCDGVSGVLMQSLFHTAGTENVSRDLSRDGLILVHSHCQWFSGICACVHTQPVKIP